MLGLLLEIVLFLVGGGVLLYFIYLEFFSGKQKHKHEKPLGTHRFERRELERDDRRKDEAGPPPDQSERRKGPRRGIDQD